MTTTEAQKTLDKIVNQVFECDNPLSLEQFMQKFAFDIRLPQPVNDIYDNSTTWTQSTNPVRFVNQKNISKLKIGGISAETDYLRPKRDIKSIEDIVSAWNEINIMTTERYLDSLNASKSDNIYSSENIYRSQDLRNSKNILFCNGIGESEFLAASQRASDSSFCIRLEDSNLCSNSFNVSWSRNATNCFFMHNTSDMTDSMFCNNISSKRFCIANMQYTEDEYRAIKNIVVQWILNE
jgi:hypothetical protein